MKADFYSLEDHGDSPKAGGLFWAFVALFLLTCCAGGAECKLVWNANPPEDKVTKYLIRVEDFSGAFTATAETAETSVTIPFVPRKTQLIITVVAINSVGPSAPAVISHCYPYRIRLTNERSKDFRTWDSYSTEEYDAQDKEFFRQRIEMLP